MPAAYMLPLGTPLYWMDETSGELRDAVMAYLNNRIDGTLITDEQITLVRTYLEYYVNAPCWKGESRLQALREKIRKADSAEKIDKWIQQALDIGMDPL